MVNNTDILSIKEEEHLYLCFLLDNDIYSLNAINVLEVATLPLLNTPQKLSDYIAGILNYNDLFINVIDIRKVLDRPIRKYDLSNKIIIVKGEESLFAIIADKVTDFYSIKSNDEQRVMGEVSSKIVKTFFKKNENLINIIDISALENFVKNVPSSGNSINYMELFPQDEESIFVLQKRRQELAKVPYMGLDTNVYEKNQYIIFKLQNHNYCLYSEYARELVDLKNLSITKIPYTPSFIVGIINLKGNFYSVLDLNSFIGFNTTSPERDIRNGQIIILEASELKLALLVDSILDIINISKENIDIKNDKNLDALFIKAEAYINNEVYNILNIDKLINDDRLYIDNSN